ncbi:protein MAINTENANCE OF MERISTEMS-like [Gossypium hirsutum]|uniref:Protein MAINTENANCE OF MERISTEMS-like n=1 Tax=Gossypium hirsutum TaxID=3635 RepID=A0ABM3AFL8_GOSHI|nr:protein MAINTENANCE OF MERISTEMS-like [Gossypium hirsutum]
MKEPDGQAPMALPPLHGAAAAAIEMSLQKLFIFAISNSKWNGPKLHTGPYRALRGRVNSVRFQPDERLIPYLELAGFGSAALIRTFDLRYDLIFALVERWRPETHTFRLPCGECTVTLEDVAVQLGLPIDGNAVTGVSSISRPATLCNELLGRSPSQGKFTSLRFSWLHANFEIQTIFM